MNQSELEDELVTLLAMVKRQQAQLDQQHQTVTAAIGDLGKERHRWVVLLNDFREFPKQAMQALETATGDAISASLADSIAKQRKTLHGAVNAATARLDQARDKTATVAITWGLIGALLGSTLAGTGMWYAVTRGHIQQTVVVNNPEGFAEALRPYLAAPTRRK